MSNHSKYSVLVSNRTQRCQKLRAIFDHQVSEQEEIHQASPKMKRQKDWYEGMIDHRSYTHNCSWKKNNNRPERDLNPPGAVLRQLSYQAKWELIVCITIYGQSHLHIFHRSLNIWFSMHSLVFFAFYAYITNSQCAQLPVGLIAQ